MAHVGVIPSRGALGVALALIGVACGATAPEPRPAEVVLAPNVVPSEEPDGRSLRADEVARLAAFARLFGVVRYFHPSDAALVTDWDALAVRGVELVERCGSSHELVLALRSLFEPIAPTASIAAANAPWSIPPGLLPPDPSAGATWIVGLQNDGLGAAGSRLFASRRVDDRPDHRLEPGTLGQAIDAAPYRGKRLRARAFVRAEIGASANDDDATPRGAFFGLHVTRPGRLDGFVDLMEDRPITERAFRAYEVEGDVDEDAVTIAIVFRFAGEGRAFIDDVTLEVVDAKPPVRMELANAGFEEGAVGDVPPGWSASDPADAASSPGARLLRASSAAGYRVDTSRERVFHGQAARIASVGVPARVLPPPREAFRADLGAGVSCAVPLTLYAHAGGTLPRSPWPRDWAKHPGPFAHDARARATRLASVIEAWSAIGFFYPYLDAVGVDWPRELETALARAATDRDPRSSLATMNRMVSALHDGNASVVLEQRDPDNGRIARWDQTDRGLPLLWEQVEGHLLITAVQHTSLARSVRRGDEVLAIDGVPAIDALEAETREVSAARREHAAWEALRRMEVGPRDRPVTLTILPRVATGAPPEPSFAVRVERDLPAGPSLWLREPRPAPIDAIEPGIVYVDLERATEEAFLEARDELAAAKGVVFDLRGHAPGLSLTPLRHLLDAPVAGPPWLVPRVTRPDRAGTELLPSTWTLPPAAPRIRGRVAFLADARTMGQAEAMLAVVEHEHLGPIVGATTSGTAGTPTSLRVAGGFRVTFTGTKVLRYDGSPHHGVGIAPTVPVPRTRTSIAAGVDDALSRALDLVETPGARR